jgi:hypothetical protein
MKTIALKLRRSWKIVELITMLTMLILFLKLKVGYRQKLKSLIKD